ncbi:MAG: DUF1559 domain-containing protein [Planctomycetaceae bacterium]
MSIVRTAAGVIEALPHRPGSQNSAVTTRPTEPNTPDAATIGRTPLAGRSKPVWTPRRIAWGLAAILALSVIALVFTGKTATVPPPVPQSTKRPHDAPAAPVVPVSPPASPKAESDSSMPQVQGPTTLAEWVIAYRDRHGYYPIENPLTQTQPENERLGWLASVVADHEPNGPQPRWDLARHDPANSRFVRRRIDPLLTPHGSAAAEGLPATHYVGVAGVGADASMLSKRHPRAGIFGLNRQTTVDDIRDGTSNTLMIVSAIPQPSPWAASALTTIRAFTAEPYINGPDGFGSGDDGLTVALADGSVKVLSSEVDPRIVRRMAAMADGLPLDPNISGEPGDSPAAPIVAGPGTPRPAQTANMAETPAASDAATDPALGSDQPIEPLLAEERRIPEPVTYDIVTALAQPIARFDQPRAVPLKTLIRDLQDMAGVPITHDDIEAARADDVLAQEFTLQSSDTTVGGLLTELLRKAKLGYVSDRSTGIRIVPAGSTPP